VTDLRIPGLEAVSLEARIIAAYEDYLSAPSQERWAKFTALHAMRSAQTVEFIEEEKGLR
jgi:hypothetical protein